MGGELTGAQAAQMPPVQGHDVQQNFKVQNVYCVSQESLLQQTILVYAVLAVVNNIKLLIRYLLSML